MSEQRTYFDQGPSSPPVGVGADRAIHASHASAAAHFRSSESEEVVRLMIELERAARAEMSVAKRVSLLRRFEPAVTRVSALMPKPVASARQIPAGGAAVPTMEQHLNWLMVENLKLALDGCGHFEMSYSPTVAHLRLWLVNRLFRFLGRLIQYSVRWDKPYPSGTWGTLHELYFDLGSRLDIGLEHYGRQGRDRFDPETEYKRLLLLGLAGRFVPKADRSSGLLEAFASLASESRLAQAAGYDGAFGLFVVGIGRDEPPAISGVIEQGFNGWVFEPAKAFRDLVSRFDTGRGQG